MSGKSLFNDEYCEQAKKLCLLGATDKQLADFFNVAESTINKWKIDFPQFSESIKNGKIAADAEVVHSLFKRATGMTFQTEKVVVVSDGKDNGSHTETVEYDTTIPPDPLSCFYWLNNRQRGNWSNKVTPNDPDDEIPVIKVQIEALNGRKTESDDSAT